MLNQRLRDLLGGFRGHQNRRIILTKHLLVRGRVLRCLAPLFRVLLSKKKITREPLESIHAWRLERGSRVKACGVT